MRLLFFVVALFCTSFAFAQVRGHFDLVKLNSEVNTFYHDAAPIISPDGQKLYFFIHNHPDNTFGKEGSDDIWMSTLGDGGIWQAPVHLRNPFNVHHSNQVFTALPDGSLFIKGGRKRDNKGFSIVSAGGALTELEVPGFEDMNKGRFYGASMSSDGKHIIMFFGALTNTPRSQLYVSNMQADGKWTKPARLNISVRDDDFGPFIGPDDKTLYFASDRRAEGRMGKADIYKTTRLDDTWQKWSEPVNMGSPVNTVGDELYFCIDKTGNIFTSRAVGGDGGSLDLVKLVPRDLYINLEGTVYDEKTRAIISTANVELKYGDKEHAKFQTGADGKWKTRINEVSGYNVGASAQGYLPKNMSFEVPQMTNDTTIYVDLYLTPVAKKLLLVGSTLDMKTIKPIPVKLVIERVGSSEKFNLQTDGSYQQEIKSMGKYMYTASAEGYLNATDSLIVDDEELTPFRKDIALQPIEVGVTVRLKNIYFDFDKTTLKSESFVELNKVVDFLNQNPHVEIEISGHTDSKGSDEYNLNLSQGRSEAVVDYLISQGIDSSRLSAHGYGESKPIDSNNTDEGRANNRRVEFTILKT